MTEFEHGTLAGYKVRRCRCGLCTAAQCRYNARWERLIAYGRWQPFVDAQPVRDHIRALGQAGLGVKRVAVLAGVPHGTMAKLVYGVPSTGRPPTRRIRPATAAALLAVRADLDTLAPRARVDAAGTIRRMQALACLGWSLGEQARRIGWTHANYASLQTRTRVNATTARTVRELYNELSMTPAPDGPGVERARREAARKRYLPPLAWDDDLIDLPAAELKAELAARAAAVDNAELARCLNAVRHLKDPSPLMRAGAREYQRRHKNRAANRSNEQEGSNAA